MLLLAGSVQAVTDTIEIGNQELQSFTSSGEQNVMQENRPVLLSHKFVYLQFTLKTQTNRSPLTVLTTLSKARTEQSLQ